MHSNAIHAFLLLIAANATPVLVCRGLSNAAWKPPLDFGYRLPDGERLFGAHKTWCGLICGIAAATLVAALLHLPAALGAGFAAVSLAGDAACSAIKRRLRIAPGTEIWLLDQIGEALLPLLIFARMLSLTPGQILGVTAVFIVLDAATARFRRG